MRDELRALGLPAVRADRGGVAFGGERDAGFRACLWSRVAVRVLEQVADFPCRDGDQLYEGVRAVRWTEHMTSKTTLAVSAVSKHSALSHTMFIAQRAKDAVVDRLRDELGARPDVDRRDPDIALFVRLHRDHASVYLDLAGDSLHRRGHRKSVGEAPLKETLAAAILRYAGYDGERPFVDPMCGSGTLALEADGIARRIAPGLSRERFGFERWASFDDAARARLRELREHARAQARAEGPEVRASDIDPQMVECTRENAERAGARLLLQVAPVKQLTGTEPPGLVCANPPYGERLSAKRSLWAELSRAFARLEPGHRVALLLGEGSGFRPPRGAAHRKLYNGALECSLVMWNIVETREREP